MQHARVPAAPGLPRPRLAPSADRQEKLRTLILLQSSIPHLHLAACQSPSCLRATKAAACIKAEQRRTTAWTNRKPCLTWRGMHWAALCRFRPTAAAAMRCVCSPDALRLSSRGLALLALGSGNWRLGYRTPAPPVGRVRCAHNQHLQLYMVRGGCRGIGSRHWRLGFSAPAKAVAGGGCVHGTTRSSICGPAPLRWLPAIESQGHEVT